MSWMKMASTRSSKNGIHLGKKPFAHFFLCFVLGFGIGLTPLRTTTTSNTKTINSNTNSITNSITSSNHLTAGLRSRKVSEQVQVDALHNNNGILLVSSGNILSNSSSTDEFNVEEEQQQQLPGEDVERKLLLVITPTQAGAFQAMYLTRLANTLKLVPPPLLWIVVELHEQSADTAELLRKTGVMYRHLACKNISEYNEFETQQRNLALQHIERHQLDGIVYFADDDNFYSLELFHELREIKRFGTWPVATLAHSEPETVLEGPVCEGHRVVGWHTDDTSKSFLRFPVNVAGFGFNSTILWDPRRWRRANRKPVRLLDTEDEDMEEETGFIQQLVEDESQMEGLPSSCSKIMVWHLHLESQSLRYPSGFKFHRLVHVLECRIFP